MPNAQPRVLPVNGSRPMEAELDFGGHRGVAVAEPVDGTDVATKAYVDTVTAGGGGGGGGVTDHGALTGLADDDHPQYVLADGSRTLTGPIAGVTPTADDHLATKSYVDTAVAGAGGGGGLSASDIDTLAELNAILTDADLIADTDARLSDARTPTAHTHDANEINAGTLNVARVPVSAIPIGDLDGVDLVGINAGQLLGHDGTNVVPVDAPAGGGSAGLTKSGPLPDAWTTSVNAHLLDPPLSGDQSMGDPWGLWVRVTHDNGVPASTAVDWLYLGDQAGDAALPATTPSTLPNNLINVWEFETAPEADGLVSGGPALSGIFLAASGGKVGPACHHATEFDAEFGLSVNTNNVGLNWTLATWIYRDPGGQLTDLQVLGVQDCRVLFRFNGTTFDVSLELDALIESSAAIAVPTDTWHHVAVVSDGTEVVVYYNGNEIIRYATARTMGGYFQAGGGTDHPHRIDQLAAWSRSLSAGEVTQIYGGGGNGLTYVDWGSSPGETVTLGSLTCNVHRTQTGAPDGSGRLLIPQRSPLEDHVEGLYVIRGDLATGDQTHVSNVETTLAFEQIKARVSQSQNGRFSVSRDGYYIVCVTLSCWAQASNRDLIIKIRRTSDNAIIVDTSERTDASATRSENAVQPAKRMPIVVELEAGQEYEVTYQLDSTNVNAITGSTAGVTADGRGIMTTLCVTRLIEEVS